jgi:hypothetical protein
MRGTSQVEFRGRELDLQIPANFGERLPCRNGSLLGKLLKYCIVDDRTYLGGIYLNRLKTIAAPLKTAGCHQR